MTDANTKTALHLILSVSPELRRLFDILRKHDRSLADQMRRAAQSVALNLSEADGQRAGHRTERLQTALGSLKETRTALQLAAAWGYLLHADVETLDVTLDRICAMTFRRLYR